jgi:hypothetical protein
MFKRQYWAHDAPDGTKPWKWFGDVGYNYNQAGENLAKNFTNTNSLMTAWLNSPEHRTNVLNTSYQDVGFAVMDGTLNGQPTTLVVALYGQPETSITGNGSTSFFGASSGQSNILTQFAVSTQSITPAVTAGLLLIALAIIVAGLAHAKRKKLPKHLRESWYKNHGLYKIAGLLSFAVIIILMCGGGKI